jgi:hypothetical protein
MYIPVLKRVSIVAIALSSVSLFCMIPGTGDFRNDWQNFADGKFSEKQIVYPYDPVIQAYVYLAVDALVSKKLGNRGNV